jgi:hypothetical protein
MNPYRSRTRKRRLKVRHKQIPLSLHEKHNTGVELKTSYGKEALKAEIDMYVLFL